MLHPGTSKASRRNVLKGVGLATVGASLPPFGAALAQSAPAAEGPKLLEMDGKAKLAVLGDKPLVAETQAELLDDNVTPTDNNYCSSALSGSYFVPANAAFEILVPADTATATYAFAQRGLSDVTAND